MGGKLIIIMLLLILTSCGPLGPITDNPIFSGATLNYNAQKNVVEFTVDLADTLEFPVGLYLPIKNYGDLEIVPSDYNDPAKVILTANLDVAGFVGGSLVTKLPNGMNFPRIITTPLLQIRVKKDYFVYVSPETLDYIGFSILIPKVNNSFPANFVVGTTFRTETGETIGSAVFFGPTADGSVSGGIFAVADISLLSDQFKSLNIGARATSSTSTNNFQITTKQLRSLDSGGFLKK